MTVFPLRLLCWRFSTYFLNFVLCFIYYYDTVNSSAFSLFCILDTNGAAPHAFSRGM